MEEKKLKCTLITPMFSYGFNQKQYPEVRTSEIKGMMRYVYRIICPMDYEILAKDEAELFGGAAGSEGADSGHASPVRLLICDNHTRKKAGPLLLHKKEHNPSVEYLQGGDFELIVRLNPYVSQMMQGHVSSVDLNWYVEFIELAFLLCGLGKRSRKGRGSVAVDGREIGTKEEILNWICCTMNKITIISSKPLKEIYRYENGEILSTYPVNRIKRPVIQKIRIGMKLTPNQVNDYLRAVDKTSHDVKNDRKKTVDQKSATGSDFHCPRFASPLIISLIKTEEGLYPLYVFVKAVVASGREIDLDCKDREEFIQSVEIEAEGRIRV